MDKQTIIKIKQLTNQKIRLINDLENNEDIDTKMITHKINHIEKTIKKLKNE